MTTDPREGSKFRHNKSLLIEASDNPDSEHQMTKLFPDEIQLIKLVTALPRRGQVLAGNFARAISQLVAAKQSRSFLVKKDSNLLALSWLYRAKDHRRRLWLFFDAQQTLATQKAKQCPPLSIFHIINRKRLSSFEARSSHSVCCNRIALQASSGGSSRQLLAI